MPKPQPKAHGDLTPWPELKAVRRSRKLTLEQLAEKADTSAGFISDLENGKRRGTREWVQRFAAALECDPSELVVGPPPAFRGYPMIGKVGAGGEGLYVDDYSMGEAADFIEPLPGMAMEADIIVLETDGDSMAPLVFDGDLAFFGPIREDVDSLLGKRVMARLSDGRKFFKILRRGSRPGRYTLRSLNPATPDIEDVAVSWVLPYRGSRPRGF